MNGHPSIACVFPGQGSQRKGMGGDLFDHYDSLCAVADDILGYSIRDLCLNNPDGKLRYTQYTQPALFVANALIWLDRTEHQPPPAFLAGHSLGEYNALFAAGCFDFEAGLRMVQQRGALMAQIEEGGMAAVLGLDETQVREVLQAQAGARGVEVDIANFNLPTQLVLSGPKSVLESLIAPMEAAGARRCLLLNVSGAFHSRYMSPTATEFETFLSQFTFEPPQIPVIANTTAKPYGPDQVARHLVDQIRTSVRWSETMDYFLAHGVAKVEELGPGKVLRKLWATASETATSPAETPPIATTLAREPQITVARKGAETLGDAGFRRDYGLRYAYVAGAPAPGVRTVEWVTSLGRAGLLGFLDSPEKDAVTRAAHTLGAGGPFGVSLHANAVHSPNGNGSVEDHTVATALEHGVRFAEVNGYTGITPALLRFRFRGAHRDTARQPIARRFLLALVSRPNIARQFLSPAPNELVTSLVAQGALTAIEGEIARELPIASDVCAVPDPSDATDLTTLLPTIQRLRDQVAAAHGHQHPSRVGAGGAIGTPEAVACAFLLGADFVHTSAINLCTVEAGVAPTVKELLAGLQIGETTQAPALDGFDHGTQVQVVRKGTLFAQRARKLYELFRFHDSLEAIAPAQLDKLEQTTFKRPLESILEELEDSPNFGPSSAKERMAWVFSWYLRQSLRWGLTAEPGEDMSYQIPCDESMAAFNTYVAGSNLADRSSRHVAAIGQRLMQDGAALLSRRLMSV